MKLRFTGEWPPQSLWAKYPNWEYALDEEDVSGQDETTLRPSPQQHEIASDVVLTAGEVEQADGRRLPALIDLLDRKPTGLTAFTTERDGWSVREWGSPPRWHCFVQDWLPAPERGPSVSFTDPGVFPLLVESRLPARQTGGRLRFRILGDGTMEEAG